MWALVSQLATRKKSLVIDTCVCERTAHCFRSEPWWRTLPAMATIKQHAEPEAPEPTHEDKPSEARKKFLNGDITWREYIEQENAG
jgi:hypothetical protein